MRTLNLSFFLLAMICLFSFQSCKKGDSTPVTPPVVIYPDTLTAGWSKVILAGEPAFSDIFFNSSTTGYLIGSKVFKSTDGGNTWLPTSAPSGNFINLFMGADSKIFLTSTNFSSITRSVDGGNTFANSVIGSPAYDLFFIDNNTGFSIAQDGLYTTVDAGATWTKVATTGLPPSLTNYSTLSIINNTTGWIAAQGVLYKSNGSLTNWQQSTITGAGQILSIYATSATIVYATDGTSIYKSVDGGSNFSLLKNFSTSGFSDVHFIDNLNGYVSIGRCVFKTTDGGANWTRVIAMGQTTLGELHFTDAGHGWVCGDGGVILIFK